MGMNEPAMGGGVEPYEPRIPTQWVRGWRPCPRQVRAVSFLKQGRGGAEVLQVRFLTAMQRSIGAGEEFAHFVATLKWLGPPSGDIICGP